MDESIRERVVRTALSHLGEGPLPEWHGLQWCGIWCLFVLHECGLALDIEWPTDGRGSFLRRHPEAFPVTISPHPGDVLCQDHKPWHHQIVTRREGTVLWTVAGNTGASPGVVGESKLYVTSPGQVFYSIEPLEAVP